MERTRFFKVAFKPKDGTLLQIVRIAAQDIFAALEIGNKMVLVGYQPFYTAIVKVHRIEDITDTMKMNTVRPESLPDKELWERIADMVGFHSYEVEWITEGETVLGFVPKCDSRPTAP